MNVNLSRGGGVPSDAEIERDVAELRRLLDGVEGPAEPHPAYWQNSVVRIRARIDAEGARRKRWSFSTAWASLGAAAVVTVVVVASGLLDKQVLAPPQRPAIAAVPSQTLAPSDLAAAYNSTDTKSIILSGDEVTMINAIVSDKSDDAVFEAMVNKTEL